MKDWSSEIELLRAESNWFTFLIILFWIVIGIVNFLTGSKKRAQRQQARSRSAPRKERQEADPEAEREVREGRSRPVERGSNMEITAEALFKALMPEELLEEEKPEPKKKSPASERPSHSLPEKRENHEARRQTRKTAHKIARSKVPLGETKIQSARETEKHVSLLVEAERQLQEIRRKGKELAPDLTSQPLGRRKLRRVQVPSALVESLKADEAKPVHRSQLAHFFPGGMAKAIIVKEILDSPRSRKKFHGHRR